MQIRWKAGWRAAPSSDALTVDEQDIRAAAVAVRQAAPVRDRTACSLTRLRGRSVVLGIRASGVARCAPPSHLVIPALLPSRPEGPQYTTVICCDCR
jgi:hypothetical protein